MTLEMTKLTTQGKQTDPDVIDECFRLWTSYGRSVRRVSEAMGIPESTLHLWRVQHQWEDRRASQAAAFLPGARAETAVALHLAGYSAAIRLQQIMYDAEANGIDPDPKVVQALTMAIDRGGFSPTGRNDPHSKAAGIRPSSQSTDDMTDDELAHRERQLSGGKRKD